jgi:hypothetical protein
MLGKASHAQGGRPIRRHQTGAAVGVFGEGLDLPQLTPFEKITSNIIILDAFHFFSRQARTIRKLNTILPDLHVNFRHA